MSDREILLVGFLFAALLGLGLLVVFARRRGAAAMSPVSDERLNAAVSAAIPPVSDERLNAAVSAAVDVRFSKIEIRMTESEHHLNQVRMQIGALPTKDSVHALDVKITEAIGEMKAVIATTTATSRAVQRIEDHLLTGAKDAS